MDKRQDDIDEMLKVFSAEEFEYLASLVAGRKESAPYRPVLEFINGNYIWTIKNLDMMGGRGNLYCGPKIRAMPVFIKICLKLGLLSKEDLHSLLIDKGGMALPLVKRLEYVNDKNELVDVLKFYNSRFRLGKAKRRYHIRCKKVDGSYCLQFEKKVITISKSEQFIVVDRELTGSGPMFEYILPYPETMGEFIDSCRRCGIVLREYT